MNLNYCLLSQLIRPSDILNRTFDEINRASKRIEDQHYIESNGISQSEGGTFYAIEWIFANVIRGVVLSYKSVWTPSATGEARVSSLSAALPVLLEFLYKSDLNIICGTLRRRSWPIEVKMAFAGSWVKRIFRNHFLFGRHVSSNPSGCPSPRTLTNSN